MALIVAGEIQYRRSEISHHKWLVERKAQLIEEERRRKEEEEHQDRERRRKAAQARVDRLLEAIDIRSYVNALRKANAVSDDPVPEEEIETWASWALAQADRIDPVRSKKFLADIADEVDESHTDEA